jgi:hypothetical protein
VPDGRLRPGPASPRIGGTPAAAASRQPDRTPASSTATAQRSPARRPRPRPIPRHSSSPSSTLPRGASYDGIAWTRSVGTRALVTATWRSGRTSPWSPRRSPGCRGSLTTTRSSASASRAVHGRTQCIRSVVSDLRPHTTTTWPRLLSKEEGTRTGPAGTGQAGISGWAERDRDVRTLGRGWLLIS